MSVCLDKGCSCYLQQRSAVKLVTAACRIGYPIVWGFCEGSDYATVSTEAICYGVLDFFAKVVFGWIVIVNLDLLATGSKDGRSA